MKKYILLFIFMISCNTAIDYKTEEREFIYGSKPNITQKVKNDTNYHYISPVDTTYWETILVNKKSDYDWRIISVYTKEKVLLTDSISIYRLYNKFFITKKDSTREIPAIVTRSL